MDLLLTWSSIDQIKEAALAFSQEFHMTDLGQCTYCLGMTVTRDRQHRIFCLGQKARVRVQISHYSYGRSSNKGCRQLQSPQWFPITTPISSRIFDACYAMNTPRSCFCNISCQSLRIKSHRSAPVSSQTYLSLHQKYSRFTTHLQRIIITFGWLHRCRLGWRSRYPQVNSWFCLQR